MALALVLMPGLAFAGDPCPIDFTFYDLGAPEWLERETLLDALQTKDSWLGMSFKTHSTPGVRVTAVSSGSPTAKAGLKVGDVIVKADGKALPTFQAFDAVLDNTTPGSSLTLTVVSGGATADKTLTLSRQDPVLGALIRHASKQDCASVSRGEGDAEWVKKAQAAAFAKNRRFQCKDAHVHLAKQGLEPGQIVLVRGSKRVLLANPGSTTTCIKAASYDGAKLTPAAVGSLFKTLTKAYVADRHANP
jgi:membrane-associated protease RseP (regulator of RpoE activity)